MAVNTVDRQSQQLNAQFIKLFLSSSQFCELSFTHWCETSWMTKQQCSTALIGCYCQFALLRSGGKIRGLFSNKGSVPRFVFTSHFCFYFLFFLILLNQISRHIQRKNHNAEINSNRQRSAKSCVI